MQGKAMSREGLQLEMRNEKLAIIAINYKVRRTLYLKE